MDLMFREKILDQIDAVTAVKESHTNEVSREFYQGVIQALQWVLVEMDK